MDTLIYTKTNDGITVRDGVRSVTYHIKDQLKMLGAKWHQGAWTFRGFQEIPMVQRLMGPCEAAYIRAMNAKEAEYQAEKARRAWLKTPEGRAATEVAKKEYVLSLFTAGCSWICCAECTIIDEKRRHTACDAHAEDGNSFRVNGRLRTGD
jgi:hypothetical protein